MYWKENEMTDTYEFLKAQKDAILAKQEAERDEWLTAALGLKVENFRCVRAK
jgi:hypothetical protein